jgi:plasmid replication initiation protein
MAKQKQKDGAKISNALIESFTKNSNIVALKTLFYISRADIELDQTRYTIKLDTKDLCSYCDIDLKTLKRSLIKMQETSIKFKDDKREAYISVLPKIEFFSGTTKLQIDIYKEILELVHQVKNRFTFIDVKQLVNLKSKHSIKMLSLLEMISGFDEHIAKRKYYELGELNKMFDTNYKRMAQFEAEILKKTKDELDQKSKLSFIYEIKYFQDNPKGRPKAVGVTIDLVSKKTIQQKLDF